MRGRVEVNEDEKLVNFVEGSNVSNKRVRGEGEGAERERKRRGRVAREEKDEGEGT